MNAETKICQNCKRQFTIEPEDFQFYEKIKVPPPTYCSVCVLQRQLSFRNARNLYRRKDSKTGKEIISIYSPDKEFVVYEQKEWNGDGWDPMEYGQEYDFERPFFAQMKELMQKVPWSSLNNWDAVNSDYCNFTKGNKNCYLVFGGDFNEDTEYSTYNFLTKNSADLYWVNKGESCYELTDSEDNYRCAYGRFLESCLDIRFGFELNGCQNCVACVNLRRQKNAILNQPYSPEEYKEKVSEMDLGSYAKNEKMRQRFRELRERSIFRPYKIFKSVNCTGDNIYNSKNCKFCFDVFDGAEDSKYIFLAAGGLKDSYNSSHLGSLSELCYNSLSVYPGSRVVASWIVIDCQDVYHSMWCRGCSHIFGCVGLRNKQYCIFNKQYTREEYEALVPKIIEQMNSAPYRDAKGRVFAYGDFFPSDLSPFAYNETTAHEYYPLTEAEVREQGYRWYVPAEKQYAVTKNSSELPDNIKEANDSILNEVIGCSHEGKCNHSCTFAFKLIPAELNLYRSLELPLPRLCPNCRNSERVAQRNPFSLWHRRCECEGSKSKRKEENQYQNTVRHSHEDNPCPNEFETSYALDRPEIVYCEQCYQQEVA